MSRVFVGRAAPHPILDVGGRLELTGDDRLPTIRCARGVASILPHYLAAHAREGYNKVLQPHGSQAIRREHCALSKTTQAKLRGLFGSYHKGDKLCKLSRRRRVEAVPL